MEQQNAAQFVQQLHGITADLVTMLSITDVDEALQTFSSNFCASKLPERKRKGEQGNVNNFSSLQMYRKIKNSFKLAFLFSVIEIWMSD